MAEPFELGAVEARDAVRSGALSPVDLLESCLARIEAVDGAVGAFVHVDAEQARAAASRIAERLATGEDPGPLAGVPFAVKDLEDVAGMPTTFGSVPFRDHRPTRDSVQVERLRAAGAVVLGKTNTPEFGSTAFTKNRLFGVTRNPWDLERTPGGSSGGSSAAVAARMVPLATASDGGGSIRIPASYVGAFGFKPTFGRVPVGPEPHGMLRWVDTVHYGPLTRSVADAALMLDVTCGTHPADPSSLPRPARPYSETINEVPGRLRIAFSRDLGHARVAAEVMAEVESFAALLTELGHDVVEIDEVFPNLGRAWAHACGGEQFAELAPLVEGQAGELGRSFWAGIESSASLTQARMGKIQRERFQLNDVLWRIFDRFDLLLTPTLPTVAFAAEGPPPDEIGGERLRSPLDAVVFTYPFNLSGHPAATLRAGTNADGLPVGAQLVAARHRDELVLQVGAEIEVEVGPPSWPDL